MDGWVLYKLILGVEVEVESVTVEARFLVIVVLRLMKDVFVRLEGYYE